MNYLFYLLYLVLIIGFLYNIWNFFAIKFKVRFLEKFLSDLETLLSQFPRSINTSNFNQLLERAITAQNYVSFLSYASPNSSFRKIHLILDTLNIVRDEITTHKAQIVNLYPEYSNSVSHLNLCINTIRMSFGHYKKLRTKYFLGIVNPLTWLRDGVQLIIIYLFSFLGLINSPVYAKENKTLKFISAILGLLLAIQSFISNNITIITGWKASISIIKNWLNLDG